MNTRARLALVALSLLGTLAFAAPRAQASGVYGSTCGNAATWTANQCDNSINDDGSSNANNFSGACYGYCGPGCSYNCGYGGACGTHDYYTRAYGMFSSQAMSAFPAAAAQWGRCVMSAGATAASGSLKSAWSGIKTAASSVVSSIFN